ncbi:GNAT family N-acetyltransferase [Cytophagaceae bacterium 50C-KIRBA]|uniref:GNAT family N-acetyltransferase n=1 Tax=Aquirufa beregesia TaxID=2516556 RepID=A0ABX0EWJ6_9BACT|nr:GNAT family N-acetyltransferase [Aquirufa beregesia]NGZ44498.1 GNAT family N-acetyltransferase [Aquirufa beregesia]
MPFNFKIRPALLEDEKAVLELVNELENRDSDPQIFAQIWREYLAHTHTYVWVTENPKNQIVGFLSVIGQNLLHHEGMVYEIQELMVTASCQGKGLGRKLIEALKNELKEKDVKSIEVTSNKRRKEAHAFYEAMGFTNSHEKFTIYF